MARTAKKAQDIYDPIEELKTTGLYTEYEPAFTDFLEAFADQEEGFQVSLFEVVKSGERNTQDVQWIKTWNNEIPAYSTIAGYGPGKYRMLLIYRERGAANRTSKSITFLISEKADAAKFAGASNVPQVAPADTTNTIGLVVGLMQQSNQNMLGIMNTFMQSLSGIMVAQAKNIQPERSGFDLSSLQKQIGNMMIENTRMTQQLLNENIMRNYELPDPNEEPESPVVKFIKEMFNEWAPRILNGNKTMQKMAAKMVRGTEEYQQIEQNPELLQKAVTDLITENPENKNKVEALLAALDIPFADGQEVSSDMTAEK